MSAPVLAEVLGYLLVVGRPLILERWHEDSCVVSTRIALEVLSYFGFSATAVPVRCVIANQIALDGMEIDMEPTALAEAGGKVVDIGTNGTGTTGHLVLVVEHEGERLLLDMSLDQAARPAFGINAEPVLVALEEGDLADGKPVIAQFDGFSVVWVAEDVTTYRRSVDWTDERRWKPLAGRLIRDLLRGPAPVSSSGASGEVRAAGGAGGRPRLKVIGIDEVESELRAMGLDPKAPPRSGRCVSCGKALNTDPAAGEVDIDHSVCNACFPEDMKAEWQGRSVDHAMVDLTGDNPTITEIQMPTDPFTGEAL